MPGFVKPDWKSITLNYGSTSCLMYCMAYPDSEIEYEGETMTRENYIKNVLFSGKYNSLSLVDHGRIGNEGEGFGLQGLYLDRSHNDCACIFAGKANPNYGYTNGIHTEVAYNTLLNAYNKRSGYTSTIELLRAFYISPSVTTGTMYVRSFNTFCVIRFYCGYNSVYDASYNLTVVYDFTNKELLMFDGRLSNVQFSKEGNFMYSKALTYDGADSGKAWKPIIRRQSNSNVTYCKVKMLDGTEATRMYMLTEFPVSAEGAILTCENKKFYVCPYDSDSFCAIAVDCSADMT